MRLALLVACGVLAAGCGSTPKESFYTLSVAPPAAPAAATSNVSVFVGPVTIPEEVDRSPMVLRTGPNQVELDELHRWAEPLKAAIPKGIAEALMQQLGTARVYSSRAGASQAVDYRV